MSRIGLQKIMDTLLIKEFPGISDIKVIPMSDGDDCKWFQISIGISPAMLTKYGGGDSIRDSANTLSKFVMDKNKDEKVMVIFYNSENKY